MIPCQRHLFDIPDDVAYLNCAYMSPLMKPALEAGTAGLARKAHPWEITPDKFFTGADEFRTTAAQFIDARPTTSPSFPQPVTALQPPHEICRSGKVRAF